MTEATSHPLTTPEEYAAGIVELLDQARREVSIFTPDMDPLVFDGGELMQAVRTFVLQNRHANIRILVRNTAAVASGGRRLVELARRLSSRIALRTLAGDFHDRDDAFVIADDSAYVLRLQASYWDGLYDETRPQRARQLRTDFDEMWEHSQPDPRLRRLHI